MKTYTGPHGNQLKVCEKCYAKLVTGELGGNVLDDPPVLDDPETYTTQSESTDDSVPDGYPTVNDDEDEVDTFSTFEDKR